MIAAIRRHTGRTRPRPDAAPQLQQQPADAGVITIVVALSLSTFLLGFAALAVDLGSAYVRQGEVTSLADQLALAGAAGLPDPDTALSRIRGTLTAHCQDLGEAELPGICPAGNQAPDFDWATDADPTNGEVTFLADPDGDLRYTFADVVDGADGSSGVSAVNVALPPSVVEFGLAAAFGRDSAVIRESASARIGTALGSGLLPFALTQDDLARGQFCVRDPSVTAPAGWPGAFGQVNLTIIDPPPPVQVAFGSPGVELRIRLSAELWPRRLDQVTFQLSNTADPVQITAVEEDLSLNRTYTVVLPVGLPVETAQIWATGVRHNLSRTVQIPFSTDPGEIIYTGLPATDTLCDEPESDRGYLQLARPGDAARFLVRNVRAGPAVTIYPVTELNAGPGDPVNCASTVFAPTSNCLVTERSPFSQDLTAGLLDRDPDSTGVPGRLVGDCGGGTLPVNGRSGIDASDLFSTPGLLDTATGGPGAALRADLTAPEQASDPPQGWITSRALRCPRMAVLPVINPNSGVGPVVGQTVIGFRYVWIDADELSRGLTLTRGQVSEIRGYIIHPRYLPARVSGSSLVGPYLGPDLPAEPLLIADIQS